MCRRSLCQGCILGGPGTQGFLSSRPTLGAQVTGTPHLSLSDLAASGAERMVNPPVGGYFPRKGKLVQAEWGAFCQWNCPPAA